MSMLMLMLMTEFETELGRQSGGKRWVAPKKSVKNVMTGMSMGEKGVFPPDRQFQWSGIPEHAELLERRGFEAVRRGGGDPASAG